MRLILILLIATNAYALHPKGLKRKTHKMLEAMPHISFLAETSVIPNKYDLKASPVENQGECGDCYDFSLTGNLRDTLLNSGRDPGRLSFNYLIDCDYETADGCSGGDFDAAEWFINPKGPPTYNQWPYTGQTSTCRHLKPVASAESYSMLGEMNGPSFRDIAYSVGVLHHPVSVDVYADMHWELYQGGVYKACTPGQVNHMVLLTGYDCEGQCKFNAEGNLPNGVGLFHVKNSWGTEWGEKGYIWTKATDKNGVKCNSVASDALIFNVDKEEISATGDDHSWPFYIFLVMVCLVAGFVILEFFGLMVD